MRRLRLRGRGEPAVQRASAHCVKQQLIHINDASKCVLPRRTFLGFFVIKNMSCVLELCGMKFVMLLIMRIKRVNSIALTIEDDFKSIFGSVITRRWTQSLPDKQF